MRQDLMFVFGFLAVTAIAVFKTFFADLYIGGLSERGMPVLLLAFAAFWAVTAAIFALVYIVARRTIETNRRARLLTQVVTNPGKENMIDIHAGEWGLTKAETEVAIMVVKGFSNAEIAAMRGSALQTVKSQLTAIYQKSGLEGRYQLIAYITDEVCETSRALCENGQVATGCQSAARTRRGGPMLTVDQADPIAPVMTKKVHINAARPQGGSCQCQDLGFNSRN